MDHGILLHNLNDDVGVAVRDLTAGSEVGAASLEGEPAGSVKLVTDVPLGHKVSLRDLPNEKHIIEYARPIGKATQDIPKGAHVHVHNIKTLRWSK